MIAVQGQVFQIVNGGATYADMLHQWPSLGAQRRGAGVLHFAKPGSSCVRKTGVPNALSILEHAPKTPQILLERFKSSQPRYKPLRSVLPSSLRPQEGGHAGQDVHRLHDGPVARQRDLLAVRHHVARGPGVRAGAPLGLKWTTVHPAAQRIHHSSRKEI